jgi:hypothetical protein
MKSPLCFLGIHFWEYRKEKHQCTGHPNGREFVRVIVRECTCCGHREHHPLPRIGKSLNLLKSFDDVGKNDCIDIKRLNDENFVKK